jgi:hypothetical protein
MSFKLEWDDDLRKNLPALKQASFEWARVPDAVQRER